MLVWIASLPSRSRRPSLPNVSNAKPALAALNHPHICQLYDVGPNYLVMEYIEGIPLKGPLPLDQTLKYAADICDALDAAHKKNITHRDVTGKRAFDGSTPASVIAAILERPAPYT
jgi:serine/threonine protein kinase